MDSKINHIRNLIYFGQVDQSFHEKEKEFIRRIGERMGIDSQIIDEEMKAVVNEAPPIPGDAILRFILIDDVLNLMASDEEINEIEIAACKKMAENLGFDSEIISVIADKLIKHSNEGFIQNQVQVLIKDELFRLTAKNKYHEKYY